jgi:hypothetical protein
MSDDVACLFDQLQDLCNDLRRVVGVSSELPFVSTERSDPQACTHPTLNKVQSPSCEVTMAYACTTCGTFLRTLSEVRDSR